MTEKSLAEFRVGIEAMVPRDLLAAPHLGYCDQWQSRRQSHRRLNKREKQGQIEVQMRLQNQQLASPEIQPGRRHPMQEHGYRHA